ncbi:rhomboid family intramembrane serine protease [Micrococcoides hystricis]|uniref:Rhomboid family intramembrane serine protease n=1 Tax=Micrococcoides hystricis TaxID=1572761 RepID=A0ABV6PBH2_9MICC
MNTSGHNPPEPEPDRPIDPDQGGQSNSGPENTPRYGQGHEPEQPRYGEPSHEEPRYGQPQYGQPRYGQQSGQGIGQPCKNHPYITTTIRCQRCGEPVCQACSTQAPVGVQCPQCMAPARAMYRQQRRRAFLKGTPVVLTLLVVNILFYLGQRAYPQLTADMWYAGAYGFEKPWRLITHGFVHSPTGFTHILLNMLSLYWIGRPMESAIGSAKFSLLYFASLIGAGLAVLLITDPMTPVVGASGAIYGIFGGLIWVSRRAQIPLVPLAVILAINLVISFTLPGISWEGHLGGLVVGLVLTPLLLPKSPNSRTSTR